MIVYVVTEGSYSDYHIEAVFADKEQANLYIKLHPDCEIEEYDTEAIKIDARKIMYEWTAIISIDGKLLSLVKKATLLPKKDGILLTESYMRGLHFEVFVSSDRELEDSIVEKVCYDRVAKFKSQYLGL